LGGVVLWGLLLITRAAKALYVNCGSERPRVMPLAADLVRLVPLLVLLDAATVAGTLDWVLRDAGRPVS
jgi:hypothetical protein